ncbi:MAG: TIM barrel protein, partial [Acidimicrobiia bacterium]|nr:TIM barrel protein [Acidimicrobiia bacterium]
MKRIGGAPITWGVDPSPGWGHVISAERYLSELTKCGLSATELGPDGFLPADDLSDFLEEYGARVVAGFVPVVLYHRDIASEALVYTERAAGQLAATGSNVIVVGPDSDQAGYDKPVALDESEWTVFFENLARFDEIAADHGLTTAVHPHWGMAVEGQESVDRVARSSDVGFCLDTGHLHLAGVDPVEFVRSFSDRVAHVHLKDVDGAMGERVRTRQVPFRQAVIEGVFRPLGAGEVDIGGVVKALEEAGYDGWYVLEQDTSLQTEPEPGEGPLVDVEHSMRYLEKV